MFGLFLTVTFHSNVPYLNPLSPSVRHSVGCKKRVNQVEQDCKTRPFIRLLYIQNIIFLSWYMWNILKELLASVVLGLCLTPSWALQRTIVPPNQVKTYPDTPSSICLNIQGTMNTHTGVLYWNSNLPWEKRAGPEPLVAALKDLP